MFQHILASLMLTALSVSAIQANPTSQPQEKAHTTRKYTTFNYPQAEAGGKTLLTGIRRSKESSKIVYISGFYKSPGDTSTVAFVYKGKLSGRGEWFALNYPSSTGVTVTATNLYGPNNGPGSDIQVVGNYTTVETGMSAIGCLYEGPINGSGTWTTLIPTLADSVINTIAHSTMGGLVVGNFDTNLDEGRAFLYDIKTQEYYEITKPGAVSITAYGIWHNGGHSYTICGGFSNADPSSGIDSAYLVDWNNKTHTLSNWRVFSYNNDPVNAVITHFDGITSDGDKGYYLTGDWAGLVNGSQAGFFAHVKKKRATWEPITYPNQPVTSGNSVYKKVVIGVYTSPNDGSVNGYVSAPK